MSNIDELRQSVAVDDGSLPARWNADDEPGATLLGTLLRFETIVTEFGEAPVAIIEDADDGTVWGVALFRSVLKKRFDTLAPRPGDLIGLKYVGLAEPRNKDGRPYHNYVMKVIRNAAAVVPLDAPRAATEPEDDELPF